MSAEKILSFLEIKKVNPPDKRSIAAPLQRLAMITMALVLSACNLTDLSFQTLSPASVAVEVQHDYGEVDQNDLDDISGLLFAVYTPPGWSPLDGAAYAGLVGGSPFNQLLTPAGTPSETGCDFVDEFGEPPPGYNTNYYTVDFGDTDELILGDGGELTFPYGFAVSGLNDVAVAVAPISPFFGGGGTDCQANNGPPATTFIVAQYLASAPAQTVPALPNALLLLLAALLALGAFGALRMRGV